jgi:hypothetical protein
LKERIKESIEVEEKTIEVDDGVGKAFQYNFASKRKRSKLMDGWIRCNKRVHLHLR